MNATFASDGLLVRHRQRQSEYFKRRESEGVFLPSCQGHRHRCAVPPSGS